MGEKSELNHTLMEGVKETTKDIKAAVALVIVTSMVQLVCSGIYSYDAYKDRQETTAQRAVDRQLAVLKDEYERRQAKFKEIVYPLVGLRSSIEEISHVCADTTISPADRKKKLNTLFAQRYQYKVALVQAYLGSQVIFGKNVYQHLHQIVEKVESTEWLSAAEVCKHYNAENYDDKMLQLNVEVEHIMFQAMADAENERIALAKQVEKDSKN